MMYIRNACMHVLTLLRIRGAGRRARAHACATGRPELIHAHGVRPRLLHGLYVRMPAYMYV